MKKNVLIVTFLCALLGASFVSTSLVNKENEVREVLAAPHASNFEEYTYSGNYYDSITATGEGMNGSLRKELTKHILPKAWPSYSGSSATSLAVLCQSADEDPTNSNNMIYLYTRDSVKKNAASSWNREHCWPQSKSGGHWGTGKAGTDLLHLRPTYNTANSTRGSDKYGEKGEGAKTRELNGMVYGWTTSGVFTPLDATKGDVARIIMYVWTAYTEYYGSLPEITNAFESYDTLLRWHTEDRPDILEGNRNNFCESSLQKNRNPFVDHPEYAWMIFGEKASKSVTDACKDAYPVSSAKVTSIEIESLPTKTVYFKNETLNTDGLKVIAHYDDSTSKDVTKNCSFSSVDMSTLGEKTVTVTYSGKSTSFKITVKDYENVSLIGVSAYINEDKLYEGKSYQLKVNINPTDAYPIPSITYQSNNTSVATVDTSGKVNALAKGNATITVTATQGSIVKTTDVVLNVEEKLLPTVSDVYECKKDDKIEFYCLYLGSYIQQNQGIFVGDGDYAVLIYGYTSSVSSFTPYETYLKVSGTVDIFNNLYEIKEASITEIDEEIGKSKVSPVTTYEFDGKESEDSDLSIESRPCVINGNVKSIEGTFDSTKDTKVTITLENGYDASIFVKKNAGLDYSNLKTELGTVGKNVIVKGFISVYQTNYQLILPVVLEESDTYKAINFANDFLSFTSPICASGTNNKDALVNLWLNLELDKFSILKSEEKLILKNAEGDEEGSVIEQAMKRYDFVAVKYHLKDFIGRDLVYPSTFTKSISFNEVSIPMIVILIATMTVFSIGVGVILITKKSK